MTQCTILIEQGVLHCLHCLHCLVSDGLTDGLTDGRTIRSYMDDDKEDNTIPMMMILLLMKTSHLVETNNKQK